MAIRGTNQVVATNVSSMTVSFPSGTAAGDFAVAFYGHAFPFSGGMPGWTQLDSQSGSFWAGGIYTKTLTSGDISTGSVTINVSGTLDGTLAIVTFTPTGNPYVSQFTPQRNGTGSASITLSLGGGAGSGDTLAYFGSNRGASTDTVNRGALQQQVNNGNLASGCLYTETGATGSVAATFLYSSAGSGNYQAIVDVSVRTPTSSAITAPIVNTGAGARHQLVKAPASVSPSNYGYVS